VSTRLSVSAANKVVKVRIEGFNGAFFMFRIDPHGVQVFQVTSALPNPAKTFTISGGPAEAIAVAITGPDAADFAIASNDCAILPVDGKCAVTVVFSPSPANPSSARSATLTVSDRETPSVPASATLVGVLSANPGLIIAPARADLGTVQIGTTVASIHFDVVNLGAAATGPLTVSLSSQGDCQGISLADGESCWISFSLTPVTLGPIAGTLTVAGGAGATAVATLTGTCVAAVDAGTDAR
jgi:hypothetical protein